MNSQTMIDATGLSRVFRGRGKAVEAVRGVDLEVQAGEIVGFLGPNGAGKTTTLRMLATLLDPTGGEARVAGCDLRTDPVGVRRRIGYVSQAGTTAPEALAGEEIVDHARLYGMERSTARARGVELFERLDLHDLWRRRCGSLSGGQRRRLDIAMGLIHGPSLVFLDEPSTGLDPQSRANLWGHVRDLRDDHGTTVFLTTHYMDEADALCDRILVIDGGTIVASGTPADLKRRVSGDVVSLTLADATAAVIAARVANGLGSTPSITGAEVRLEVADGASALPMLLRAIDQEGLTALAISVHRPTLDDVFLTLTGRSLREAA